LILASCGGHLELVQWLCSQGCSLQQRTIDGDTALLLACYCGHAHLVEWIIANGGTLSQRNNSGLTPLISAANGGHPAVVDILLQHGANIDETDNDGYSAVLLSARRGYLPTVQWLAVHGADIGARTKQGLDAVALSFEHADVSICINCDNSGSPVALYPSHNPPYLPARENDNLPCRSFKLACTKQNSSSPSAGHRGCLILAAFLFFSGARMVPTDQGFFPAAHSHADSFTDACGTTAAVWRAPTSDNIAEPRSHSAGLG